jgi:hypothetical protein
MADGFLGRWSKRKLDAKDGRPLEAEPLAVPSPPFDKLRTGQASPASGRGSELQAPSPPGGEGRGEGQAAEAPPPLTLEDAQALTTDSDFRPFAARDVAPEVRNAAMKKLFTDPHFNVMDRLDTYIDDYSQPDPIPKDMLRKLASAKFLGLFDAEEKQEADEEEARKKAAAAREVADDPTTETMAQSAEPEVVPPGLPDDDPDLRLQQDHASPGEKPGDGAA